MFEKYKLHRATYYYYNLLNSEEKEFYKSALYSLLNLRDELVMDIKLSSASVQKVLRYIVQDRPDIFWFNGKCTITSSANIIVKISFSYIYSTEYIKKTIDQICSSKFYNTVNTLIQNKANDFEKALCAYEYLIKNTEYDEAAAHSEADCYNYAHGIAGVMLKGKAVCSGYAKTFQYLMSKHNVVCTLVTGETSKERHAWNLINLYGNYYYIDVTWGDPVFSNREKKNSDYISYDYFCITTDELMKSHRPKFDDQMPKCVANKYNYYHYYGLIDDTYSIKNIATHIVSAKRNLKTEAVVKYTRQAEFQRAITQLFKKSEIFEALKLASLNVKGINVKQVNYSTDPEKLIIKISV